jgi:hypothetical protein
MLERSLNSQERSRQNRQIEYIQVDDDDDEDELDKQDNEDIPLKKIYIRCKRQHKNNIIRSIEKK